jgi:ABC-2 type transport system ATP-binding protein
MRSMLLTTHDMEEAQALADRVVVLPAGRDAAEGTPLLIGGRDTALTRVTFALPSAAMSDLPVTAAPDRNGGFVVETAMPTYALHQLTSDAAPARVPEGSRQ